MAQWRRVYLWVFSVNWTIGIDPDRDYDYDNDSRFTDNESEAAR